MDTAVERDRQVAHMIRAEILKVKANAERCGWEPHTAAWNRAFGEMAGMYRILSLIDPRGHEEETVHRMGRILFSGDKTDVMALVRYAQALEAQIERLTAENADLQHDINRHLDICTSLTADNERLRAALLDIASQNKWSEIALDSQGAHTGLSIVNEMQTIARNALHQQAKP